MITPRIILHLAVLMSLAFAAGIRAQSSAFTDQGQLKTNGQPASGAFDLRFALFDVSGPQVGPTITNLDVGVSNGLFTTIVDFSSPVFEERNRFLEIAVRPAASAALFEVLSPRQFLASAPKASFACGESVNP